jgi:hypothetical protein
MIRVSMSSVKIVNPLSIAIAKVPFENSTMHMSLISLAPYSLSCITNSRVSALMTLIWQSYQPTVTTNSDPLKW